MFNQKNFSCFLFLLTLISITLIDCRKIIKDFRNINNVGIDFVTNIHRYHFKKPTTKEIPFRNTPLVHNFSPNKNYILDDFQVFKIKTIQGGLCATCHEGSNNILTQENCDGSNTAQDWYIRATEDKHRIFACVKYDKIIQISEDSYQKFANKEIKNAKLFTSPELNWSKNQFLKMDVGYSSTGFFSEILNLKFRDYSHNRARYFAIGRSNRNSVRRSRYYARGLNSKFNYNTDVGKILQFCFDDKGRKATGSELEIAECNNRNPNQRFKKVQKRNYYYKIMSNSGLCLACDQRGYFINQVDCNMNNSGLLWFTNGSKDKTKFRWTCAYNRHLDMNLDTRRARKMPYGSYHKGTHTHQFWEYDTRRLTISQEVSNQGRICLGGDSDFGNSNHGLLNRFRNRNSSPRPGHFFDISKCAENKPDQMFRLIPAGSIRG